MKLKKARSESLMIERVLADECDRIKIVGSIRRRKNDVKDFDFAIIPKRGASKKLIFDMLKGICGRCIVCGDSKMAFNYRGNMKVEVNFCPDESMWGAFLLHHTGSSQYNIRLRYLAKLKGMKLNQYGLWHGDRQLAGETEQEVCEALGVSYRSPEDRDN